MTRITTALLSIALVGNAIAFSPNSVKPLHSHSTTKLNSFAMDSDEDAMNMMMKADLCAHSDTCSLDDAEHYLEEVLHMQSDCASGSLSSEKICEDITFPTQVIASLRQKVENERRKSTFDLSPVVVSLGAAYLVAGAYTMVHNPGVEVFTPEEFWWGVRDGYAGEMISAFLRHGGLPAVDQVDVSPFTPQEVWWSIRDGYFGDMLAQATKNGGLVEYVDTPVNDIATASFLPEEWYNSVKDGYASDMISHYFKHGGL